MSITQERTSRHEVIAAAGPAKFDTEDHLEGGSTKQRIAESDAERQSDTAAFRGGTRFPDDAKLFKYKRGPVLARRFVKELREKQRGGFVYLFKEVDVGRSDTFIPLNRNYKPMGWGRDAWADYEAMTDHHVRFLTDPADLAGVFVAGSYCSNFGRSSRWNKERAFWLFNDAPESLADYDERLAKIWDAVVGGVR